MIESRGNYMQEVGRSDMIVLLISHMLLILLILYYVIQRYHYYRSITTGHACPVNIEYTLCR